MAEVCPEPYDAAVAAALVDGVKEPAAPMARVKMDSRLERGADREAACVFVDESEGRCCDCFLGERFLAMVNLVEREEERRSLPEPDTPWGGGEAEAEGRIAAR